MLSFKLLHNFLLSPCINQLSPTALTDKDTESAIGAMGKLAPTKSLLCLHCLCTWGPRTVRARENMVGKLRVAYLCLFLRESGQRQLDLPELGDGEHR